MRETMIQDMERVLISRERIQERIAELAAQISRDYEGKSIVMVCILKGAVFFFSDLAQKLDANVRIDFIAISSYGASSRSSGAVRLLKDLDSGVEGEHVLVVEDIVDTGLSMNYLLGNLANRNPASLRLVTLLDKPSRREVEVPIDYIGFSVPNEFVVGYGFDYNQKYRNLDSIYVLKRSVYAK